MHAHLSVSDGVYGILLGMDVKGEIAILGRVADRNNKGDFEELLSITKQLLGKLNNT